MALAAWLTAFGGAARAADDEEALIRRGVELRKRGDDRAALQELQRAYQVARSPRAAAQLGFAEQALAMWPQAETHVSESLRAKDDPWINKNRAVVEESLRTIRAHVGRIEISGRPAGSGRRRQRTARRHDAAGGSLSRSASGPSISRSGPRAICRRSRP